MKIFLFTILVLLCSTSNAQVFQGTWEGIYITSDSTFWDSIKLDCKWNSDNTYTIKSYTKGKNTLIVCKVEYKIISSDSLVLFETEIIEPSGEHSGICFQTMELKYRLGHHMQKNLVGHWYCTDEKSKGNGFLRLQRRKL